MEDKGLGLNRPYTLPLAIVQFFFMVIKVVMMVEVDICFNITVPIPLAIVYK